MAGRAAQTTTSPTTRLPPWWLTVPKIRAPRTMKAPWAKLTTPVARNTRTKPTPIRARMHPVVRPVSVIVARLAFTGHLPGGAGAAGARAAATCGSRGRSPEYEVRLDDLRGLRGRVPRVDELVRVGRVQRRRPAEGARDQAGQGQLERLERGGQIRAAARIAAGLECLRDPVHGEEPGDADDAVELGRRSLADALHPGDVHGGARLRRGRVGDVLRRGDPVQVRVLDRGDALIADAVVRGHDGGVVASGAQRLHQRQGHGGDRLGVDDGRLRCYY